MLTLQETPIQFAEISAISRSLAGTKSIDASSAIKKDFTEILEEVCEILQVHIQDALSKSREVDFVHARQIAMYKMYNLGYTSNKEVGKYFNRDHSTVVHARNSIEGLTKQNDPKFYRKLMLCTHV